MSAEEKSRIAKSDELSNIDEPHELTDQLLGKTLGDRYLVIRSVGSGGMSTVYQATDLTAKTTVAIKILPPGHRTDSRSLARFEQGARAASRLNHPNIARVLESGVYNLNQPYIVMEFIFGQSLDEILKQQKTLAITRALKLMVQVLDALDHAHQNRVIHRDLKTSNIMTVTAPEHEETVKIVDFGIAKIVQEGSGQQLTNTGEVFGSPLYMSPEQCAGLAVDRRSDIYSLGCVLYECLTGFPPHIGTSPLATLMKHQQETPLSMKEATLGTPFPDELEAIVAKMLAKRPDDRYRSAPELKGVIEEFLSGKQVLDVAVKNEPPPGDDFFHDVGVSRQHNFQKIDLSMLKESEPKIITRRNVPLFIFMALSIVATGATLFAVFSGAFSPKPKPVDAPKDLISKADAVRIWSDADKKSWSKKDHATSDNFRLEFYARTPDRTTLNCSGHHADASHWNLLTSFKQLRNLNVSQSNIDSSVLPQLGQQPLMSLDLGGLLTESEEGYRKLTAADLHNILKINSLVSLSLRQNEIAPDVLQELGANIRELNLTECPAISNRSLAAVARLPNLRRLMLRGCRISDDGLDHLSKCKSLDYLDVTNCKQLSPQAIEKLHNELPLCVIASDY
jgi:serine/threonine protein kinase